MCGESVRSAEEVGEYCGAGGECAAVLRRTLGALAGWLVAAIVAAAARDFKRRRPRPNCLSHARPGGGGRRWREAKKIFSASVAGLGQFN